MHVDPVGTLIVPALLALAGFGVFGWAKPVPVTSAGSQPAQPGLLRLSGRPGRQRVLAVIFAARFLRFVRPTSRPRGASRTVAQVVFYASLVNVGLFVFNLIPVPPLDGSVLFERLLPARYWPTYLKYRQYTMPVLLGIVLANFLLFPHGPHWLSTVSTAGGSACCSLSCRSTDQRGGSRGRSPTASAARA